MNSRFGEPSKVKYRKKENLPSKWKGPVSRINRSRADRVFPVEGRPQMNGKCVKWSLHVISPKVKPTLAG